jgi:hypothetical protein
MHVPGPQHILDTILRDGIKRLSWWLVWEASAKAVCQWLHVQSRRDFLKARLQCHASDIANLLDKSCEIFADWRWKTLGNVTSDLKRMEVALCHATAGLQVKGLVTRDSTQAKQFFDSYAFELVLVTVPRA